MSRTPWPAAPLLRAVVEPEDCPLMGRFMPSANSALPVRRAGLPGRCFVLQQLTGLFQMARFLLLPNITGNWATMTSQDILTGIRGIRGRPLFAIIASLTLALGIGGTTAMFSVIHAVLLQPLPYAQPERLVTSLSNTSVPELEDISAQAASLERLGGVARMYLDDTGGGEPRKVAAGLVTAGLFEVLGVPALVGDVLRPSEDAFGAEPVVVLSHHFWQ
jgi:hypothetical protein